MKEFYKNNRVFVILMLFVIFCFLIIGVCLFIYFYHGISTEKYGDRLNEQSKYVITTDHKKDVVETLNADESVKSSTIRLSGRIIYITIYMEDSSTLLEGQNKTILALDKFSDEEKSYYEFQFILINESKDNNYIITGAKSVMNTNVVWNNNTPILEESESEE